MVTSQLTTLIKETLSSIPWQTALQPTLPAHDVSVVFHEPAILAGYRVPYKPWRYYLFSIFQLHNETANVWTHLIGILLIFLRFYGYFQEFDISSHKILSILIPFATASVISLFISSAVHLLHARSPYIHFVGFMIDYIGAAINTFGYGIAFFYGHADKKTYESYKNIHLPIVATVSFSNFVIMCLAKIWYGHDPHNMQRKYMMLGGMTVQALVNFFPAVPRYNHCMQDDTCSISSLNHITIISIVFLLQAIAFAAHQPEKTWPGKFDVVGHGHQVFHVLIVVNMFLEMDAIYKDRMLGVTSHSDPNMVLLLGVIVLLIAMMVLVLKYLVRYVPQALKRIIIETSHNESLSADDDTHHFNE